MGPVSDKHTRGIFLWEILVESKPNSFALNLSIVWEKKQQTVIGGYFNPQLPKNKEWKNGRDIKGKTYWDDPSAENLAEAVE